ncbi:hypothetical protein FHS57_001095 [Runella defluvii]|uniref:Uncharacterized protein n=1 Tax=Runella defluvii TaxID=370973 RepID=A0A7W5ZJV9_9BACT|nr:hypothetical protein [Runella defluvii]
MRIGTRSLVPIFVLAHRPDVPSGRKCVLAAATMVYTIFND